MVSAATRRAHTRRPPAPKTTPRRGRSGPATWHGLEQAVLGGHGPPTTPAGRAHQITSTPPIRCTADCTPSSGRPPGPRPRPAREDDGEARTRRGRPDRRAPTPASVPPSLGAASPATIPGTPGAEGRHTAPGTRPLRPWKQHDESRTKATTARREGEGGDLGWRGSAAACAPRREAATSVEAIMVDCEPCRAAFLHDRVSVAEPRRRDGVQLACTSTVPPLGVSSPVHLAGAVGSTIAAPAVAAVTFCCSAPRADQPASPWPAPRLGVG